MSRSYKRNPIIKDNGKSKKFAKRLATRKIRHLNNKFEDEVPSGKAYKKYFESWFIADYVCRWSEQDAINYYNKKLAEASLGEDDQVIRDYPTLEDFLAWWRKHYVHK